MTATPNRPILGVLVPAHDEEALLGDCLSGLRAAAEAVADRARVCVLVVLDACGDRTEAVARRHRVGWLRLAARNVGRARAVGAAALLGRRGGAAGWIAVTDADSVVPPGWLAAQLDAHDDGADAWVGTVEVADWTGLPERVRTRYCAAYAADRPARDAHRHVHGAALGVSARAYRAVGGFPPIATGEDVAFVDRLDRTGYRVRRDAAHPVVTSARTQGRAPQGFAGHLRLLAGTHVLRVVRGTTGPGPRPARSRGLDDRPAARIS